MSHESQPETNPAGSAADAAGSDPGAEEEFAPTPFDGPYLLPVVLIGLALWFGYDGWFNDDPGIRRYGWFNQGGAVLWSALALWFLYKARRESADPDR